MYKFKDKIYEVKRLLSEEEGDLPPPPPLEDDPAAAEDPEAAPPDDPAAAPDPAAASEMDNAPDDMQKVKLDMVESVRKALVINPNDVDRSLYAKLTNTTTLENLDEMEATVQELVNNYYPDTQL
jgi:hypothetical protein